ncbi:MAG: LytTR family transcriptional regulator [Clostridia bacterium]|nr:LytTR family transcriptional regulator [Clostridia bacterium]MBQ9848961.1 LytTR family transcriptional regulator [Clostridia bacterium]
MSIKVRLEIDPNGEEEIIIKAKSLSEEVLRIEAALRGGSAFSSEMELKQGGNDFFIKTKDILFFETDGSKTAAHTRDKMYYTELKLYELAEQLPHYFMRISKSCIININAVSSTRRELTGICEAFFEGTAKKVFISRSYYKPFREAVKEIRLKR